MKTNYFNSFFKRLGKLLTMDFTKDEQGMKSLRSEAKVSRYRLHEACALDTARSPSETELAALMAYDRGEPAALDELVKQGYVFGTLQEVIRRWHEISLRDAGWLGQRESVANSAASPAREMAVANALDPSEAIDFSEEADGWFKISPYGEFRGKTPGRPQHVSVESARAMESEFNSLLGKLGRTFRGVPIYHGHPDVDPELWPDDRRIGKICKLEARADGLWGYAEWNSVGKENKAEGWWIYPSPRWDAPPGQTRFSPDRLISVGLTNTPRILESDPVFNSHLTDTTDIMDPTLLRQKLGLAPEATEDEILAKIDSLTAAATEKEPAEPPVENMEPPAAEALANSLAESAREITSLRTAHNAILLDAAIADSRITPVERPAWELRLAGANRAEEINSLAGLPKKLNGAGLNLSARREERKQGDDLREQVANAISKLQKDEGLNYHEAHVRTKKNPAFKAYFDRSEG